MSSVVWYYQLDERKGIWPAKNTLLNLGRFPWKHLATCGDFSNSPIKQQLKDNHNKAAGLLQHEIEALKNLHMKDSSK